MMSFEKLSIHKKLKVKFTNNYLKSKKVMLKIWWTKVKCQMILEMYTYYIRWKDSPWVNEVWYIVLTIETLFNYLILSNHYWKIMVTSIVIKVCTIKCQSTSNLATMSYWQVETLVISLRLMMQYKALIIYLSFDYIQRRSM